MSALNTDLGRTVGDRIYDVCVVGASEAGCFAAVEAAKLGATVLLTSDSPRIGGMMGWGHNYQDFTPSKTPAVLTKSVRAFLGEIAVEQTTQKSLQTWWSRGNSKPYWFIRKWSELIARYPNITVLYNVTPTSLSMAGTRIISAQFDGLSTATAIRARTWVEGTPEGDMVRLALTSKQLGRESAAANSETHAGVLAPAAWPDSTSVDPYSTEGNSATPLCYGIDPAGPGSVGAGDGKVMGFNYRLFLTSVTAEKIAFPQPSEYDPSKYELLGRAFAANPTYYGDAVEGLNRVLYFYDVGLATGSAAMGPTFHTYADLNSIGPMSSNYPNFNECQEYPSASPARRTVIRENIKQWLLGLFKFLVTDSRVPAALKTAFQAYGLSSSDLTAYGGFSPQIYVREGWRAVGDFVMNENHMALANGFTDTIAYASGDMDSHQVRLVVSGGAVKPEGAILNALGTNYGIPIPIRVLFPKLTECTNLVLAQGASVSRVVHLSTRWMPSMMSMGAAAGVVAATAARDDINIQSVIVARVQQILDINSVWDGSVLSTDGTYGEGTLTVTGSWTSVAARFGFVGATYKRDGGAGSAATLKFANYVWKTGAYRALFKYPPAGTIAGGDEGRATNLTVTISHADGTATRTMSQQYGAGQTGVGGHWEDLGVFTFRRGVPSADYVLIDATSADGYVAASAVKLVPVT